MRKLFAALALVALTACAIVQAPQDTVFAARSAQNVALRAAVEYKHLAPCSAAVKQPCSDKEVVAQLQKADVVADKALEAAETAVRTPGFGTDVINSAVTAAKAALGAFQAIVAVIGRK